MTTLEFIYFICNESEEPCEDGIEFAKNNPNVLNAIDTLLTNKSEIQYVLWACWQEKVMGWIKYNEMFDNIFSISHSFETGVNALNQKCAEILKKFVVDNKFE